MDEWYRCNPLAHSFDWSFYPAANTNERNHRESVGLDRHAQVAGNSEYFAALVAVFGGAVWIARVGIGHIELTGKQIDAIALSPDGFQGSDDLPFADGFISANAHALVTGNLRHFSPLV